jgi:hypothetical protein
LDAARTAVVADAVVHPVVNHAVVNIGIVNVRHIHIVDSPVVLKSVAIPAAPAVAIAEEPEAVVHATIETNLPVPISRMKAV